MNRLLPLTLVLSLGCFSGGGQTDPDRRPSNTYDIALPSGYRIDLVSEGLDFPVGITFDEQGTPFIIEAGYSYGEVFTVPRIVELLPNGEQKVIYEGQNPPWNGATYAHGRFYIAEGSQLTFGRIIEVDRNGQLREVVTGLPSLGDHHTDGPLVSPDGYLYWGQGTATNSAVVGEDNALMGWLKRFPEFHDIPCQDITLTGENYKSKNPLTEDKDDEVLTGAYLPFGTPSTPGQVVKGNLPCTGAVMRVRLDPDRLPEAPVPPIELVAWGFRNPFGLAFGADNALYVTDNGFDERGSRKPFGTGDLLFRVDPGTWYGWPDFSGKRPLDTQRFDPPFSKAPKRLLQSTPGTPPEALAYFGVHSSSNGFDISKSDRFGHRGQAFVAQFGDMSPGVGNVLKPVGFKVVRVNMENGVIHDFAINGGRKNGPASYLETGGLERPVAARFSPDGSALYVVDFGVMTIEPGGACAPAGHRPHLEDHP